jgi:hypothetical protein
MATILTTTAMMITITARAKLNKGFAVRLGQVA